MEKTIFLFKRHKDRSAQNFARHYIENHAPLGARLTRCLKGYTVNIARGETGPDAVTEHWVPSALDLLTPDKAYASPQDFQEVFADDRTLFDGFDLYVVVEEMTLVAGEPLSSPLGKETPESKAIWMYSGLDAVPPPPAGARRVIDNRVSHKLVFDNGGWKAMDPDIQLIRMAWGLEKVDVQVGGRAVAVREYRFIPLEGGLLPKAAAMAP